MSDTLPNESSNIDIFDLLLTSNEDIDTYSSYEQFNTEYKIKNIYENYIGANMDSNDNEKDNIYNENILQLPKLVRTFHVAYLLLGLKSLPSQMVALDASRCWIVYWIYHSLNLLNVINGIDNNIICNSINFLSSCQNITNLNFNNLDFDAYKLDYMKPNVTIGGYGGGPSQLSHLAPSYASVSALITIGTTQAYVSIDRESIYKFLLALKTDIGSFCMHLDGESDIRGTYTALAVASHLNLLTPQLTRNSAEYIRLCQRYDGGFGGDIGNESHGGYTFCALASILLLCRSDDISPLLNINLQALENWVISRQMRLEGGYSGRANKLVDACYSFWVGALGPMLLIANKLISIYKLGNKLTDLEIFELYNSWDIYENHYLNIESMKRYLLICCQENRGGMIDKPGKNRDYYHTCYALSGLSLCISELNKINVIYNITIEKVKSARAYFYKN